MSNGKVLRYTDPRRFGAGCGPERWKAIRYWRILARSRSATRSTPTISSKMREEENRDQTTADG